MAKKKYIESPERMWELFTEYKEWVKSNPILVHDFVGRDAMEVYRKKERPLTLEGFKCFGYDNGVTIKHYFDNQDGSYDDYCTICHHIREIIRDEQINGGMVGIYNPSITQRLNGLTEKTENTTTINTDGELIITGKKFAKGE